MPIDVEMNIRSNTVAVFKQIDWMVMRAAFDSQNYFGKRCDEKVYENDIAERLITAGLEKVYTQVPLYVRWRTFSKRYFLDLVVKGVVYELKALATLTTVHEAQALNYAALLEISRIKLINLGSSSVQGRLQSTVRFDITISKDAFSPLSEACIHLPEHIGCLLNELGGFLSPALYTEALASEFGGLDHCTRRLPVLRAGKEFGTHQVLLHDNEVSFFITALPSNQLINYSKHLMSIYTRLPILGLQWINIHHTHVQLVTIKGKSHIPI